MSFEADPNKSFNENFEDFIRYLEKEFKIKEAKTSLGNIFHTIDCCIKFKFRQDVFEVIKILLLALPKYRSLVDNDEIYLQFFYHVDDLRLAVDDSDNLLQQEAWQRIEAWRKSGKPSFILDFEALKRLANID